MHVIDYIDCISLTWTGGQDINRTRT